MSLVDHEDDEPDSLVQSSFVIPCAPVASSRTETSDATSLVDDGFPSLTLFETDHRAGVMRKEAYTKSVDVVRAAFQRVQADIHAPIVNAVLNVFSEAQRETSTRESFYIPGPARLTTAAVLGASLSSQWAGDLKVAIQGHSENTLWVRVHARECFNLTTALRLVTSRTLLQRHPDHAAAADNYDLGDPASLLTLGKDTTVCIFIDNVDIFHYGVLNDLLQATHSLSIEHDAPTFVVILSAETGAGVLDDKLDPETLPILEMTRIKKSAVPTVGFEKVLEELYLARDACNATTVWLSGDVLDFLREQYYGKWPTLDEMMSTIKVALHHHFSCQPLSVLAAIGTSKADITLFTDAFAQRVRLALLHDVASNDSRRQIELPVPDNRQGMDGAASGVDREPGVSKQKHLMQLLHDDQYLYSHLWEFALTLRSHRTAFGSAVRIVHIIAANSASEGDDRLYQRPRRLEKGGLVFALLDKRQARNIIQEVRSTIRSRLLVDVERLLEKIAESGALLGTKHKRHFDTLRDKIEDLMLSSESDGDNNNNGGLEDKRFSGVQKRLIREESSTTVKRELGDWMARCLRDLLRLDAPPMPLEEEAWAYSDVKYLRSIISPAPRVNILAALNDPAAYLSQGSAKKMLPGDVPDVCRAYQTYQDAGRMINLADWYSAFRLSLQHGESKTQSSTPTNANGSIDTPKKRGRPRKIPQPDIEADKEDDNDDDGDSEEEAQQRKRQLLTPSSKEKGAWDRADMVQARFALAVHELGRMGFLKRTRRKAEHIVKVVHDLAPVKH